MQKAIEHSAICFGVYHGEKQIGFARVISDLAVFGYLADVFILQEYRHKGIGKWLIRTISDCPELQNLKTFTLFTKTPELYYEAGFNIFDQNGTSKFMKLS